MKCAFRATKPSQAGQTVCPTHKRCCAFCNVKNCWQRCRDGNKSCKYFIDEPDTEELEQ